MRLARGRRSRAPNFETGVDRLSGEGRPLDVSGLGMADKLRLKLLANGKLPAPPTEHLQRAANDLRFRKVVDFEVKPATAG